MSNSTKTRDRFTGTVVDWNTNGYYDLYYTEPSRDTNCAANESCSKNPHYAGKCLSIFYEGHFICNSVKKIAYDRECEKLQISKQPSGLCLNLQSDVHIS
jgi:hypothetical protein